MKTLIVTLFILLSGCASNPHTNTHDVAATDKNVDKFETFNRGVFTFNLTVDRWFLKPVSKGYDRVMPQPVKGGVGNFFDNLSEIRNVVNDILQWKWKQAGVDSSRFLINSTAGVAGLFDVADKIGLEDNDGEDFGQTLAVWGVPQGPYLMLPILGPSTIRGVGGRVGNWPTNPLNHIEDEELYWSLYALDTVHFRASLLDEEKLAKGDFYLFIRDAYLQRRNYLINDGEVDDSFGDDFDEELDDWGDDSF